MAKVNIVGGKHSFTYTACHGRYGNGHECIDYTHAKLVEGLLDGTISKTESSIVPLWNSNVGTVNMDSQTRTTQIFMGLAGSIVDLWPERILFELGVSGTKGLAIEGNVHSVHVAQEQCSKFLKDIGVYGSERFKGKDTTTLAADQFQKIAREGDGLLCGGDLLTELKITKQGDKANPFNFTVFSTINTLPYATAIKNPGFSLAAVLVNLNGDRLPIDFTNYWQGLFTEQDAETTTSITQSIPKIMFIIRYEEAKALLLMEMPTANLTDNPWPIPDIDLDSGLEMTSNLVSLSHVGGINDSYTDTEKLLFLDKFRQKEEEVVFYSNKGTFVWGCPLLSIFVHGFDLTLVKECARLQLNRLVQLMNYGIEIPQNMKSLLNTFTQEPQKLGLAPEAQPDTP